VWATRTNLGTWFATCRHSAVDKQRKDVHGTQRTFPKGVAAWSDPRKWGQGAFARAVIFSTTTQVQRPEAEMAVTHVSFSVNAKKPNRKQRGHAPSATTPVSNQATPPAFVDTMRAFILALLVAVAPFGAASSLRTSASLVCSRCCPDGGKAPQSLACPSWSVGAACACLTQANSHLTPPPSPTPCLLRRQRRWQRQYSSPQRRRAQTRTWMVGWLGLAVFAAPTAPSSDDSTDEFGLL
jgi:hypothetical protein